MSTSVTASVVLEKRTIFSSVKIMMQKQEQQWQMTKKHHHRLSSSAAANGEDSHQTPHNWAPKFHQKPFDFII
jgi:hypothetical protein